MAGRYQITEILGSGATSTVCVVRRTDGEILALKVLTDEAMLDPVAITRARDEATLLRRLRHPHILEVTDQLDYHGRPVLEMEWIRGVPCDLLVRQGVLSAANALAIVARVAMALDAAYYAPIDGLPMRIVHRDVKPSNILVSISGQVKLVDFGLAKAHFKDRLTQTFSGVLGTPGYRPPEGLTDSPAIDVYSLGATLLALLSGKQLVLRLRPKEHDEGVVRALGLLQADLPDAVAGRVTALLTTMLAFEPGARPELREVAAELQRLLGHPALHADLFPFAHTVVRDLYEANRDTTPPQQHASFSGVSFVESEQPSRRPLLDRTTAERAVRKMLRRPHWTQERVTLHGILERAESPVQGPFLEVLRRARIPWWRFWERPSQPDEIEAALVLLAGHPNPEVLALAKHLTQHGNRKISHAAHTLLRLTPAPSAGRSHGPPAPHHDPTA